MRRTTTSLFDDESGFVVVVRILLSAVVLGVSAADEYPCGSWKKEDTLSQGFAMREPYINTEYGCKMSCMGSPQCTGIGVYYKKASKVECFLDFSTAAIALKAQNFSGMTVWRFARKGVCQVHCMYAFTVTAGIHIKKGEQDQQGVTTVHDCKVACMKLDGCIGFNWWEKDLHGRLCRLITETGPMEEEGTAALYFYRRTSCSGLYVSAKINPLMWGAIGSWCVPFLLLASFLVSVASSGGI